MQTEAAVVGAADDIGALLVLVPPHLPAVARSYPMAVLYGVVTYSLPS